MSHDSYTSMTNSLFSSLQLSTCADSLCFKSSAVTFLSPFGDYVGVGDVWWVRRCSSLVVLLELWQTETCLTCKIIMLLDKYNMYRSWHNSYVFDFFLIISKIRSHEVHRKGRDCGSLWHPRCQRLIQIWSLLVPKKTRWPWLKCQSWDLGDVTLATSTIYDAANSLGQQMKWNTTSSRSIRNVKHYKPNHFSSFSSYFLGGPRNTILTLVPVAETHLIVTFLQWSFVSGESSCDGNVAIVSIFWHWACLHCLDWI